MLKSYLTIALRSLKRNKSYAAINIIGLAVGIAACLLLFLVIRYEESFDNFHTKKDQIYRVVSEFKNGERDNFSAGVPFPVGKTLRIDYPQLKKVLLFTRTDNIPVLVQGSNGEVLKKFKEERGVFYAEPEFFDLFDFKLVAGDIKTAITEPNTALLSQVHCRKIF
jgi:putative ABC transport system permease protein